MAFFNKLVSILANVNSHSEKRRTSIVAMPTQKSHQREKNHGILPWKNPRPVRSLRKNNLPSVWRLAKSTHTLLGVVSLCLIQTPLRKSFQFWCKYSFHIGLLLYSASVLFLFFGTDLSLDEQQNATMPKNIAVTISLLLPLCFLFLSR